MATAVAGRGVDSPISIRRSPSALIPTIEASVERDMPRFLRRSTIALLLLTVRFCQVLPKLANENALSVAVPPKRE